jgi:hypothetical protein
MEKAFCTSLGRGSRPSEKMKGKRGLYYGREKGK